MCCADFRAQRQLVKNPPDLRFNLRKATAERAKYLQTVKGFRCENPINPIKISLLRYAGQQGGRAAGQYGQRVSEEQGADQTAKRVRRDGCDANLMKFQLKVKPCGTCYLPVPIIHACEGPKGVTATTTSDLQIELCLRITADDPLTFPAKRS